MKLVKIYRRYTLVTLALVILLGIFLFYNIIMYFVHQSDNHTLLEFKENLELYIDETGKLPSNSLLNKGRITHCKLDEGLEIEPHFADTVVYSRFKDENVVYRTLTYSQKTPQGNVRITLWQTSMDTEDLISAVILSLISLFILYVLFSLWWNRWFVRRIWRPFYQVLNQLNSVDLNKRNKIVIDACDVDEFKTLTDVSNRMLQRIYEDYTTLQGLTETTSHELQTPLSVIKAKIEMLQQDQSITEKQFEQVKSLEMAVDRLIRVNRFLLMLARINNNQFIDVEKVSLNMCVDEFLSSYDDFIELKGIKVRKYYTEGFTLMIHPQLGEILISNLLSNAIRYNIKDGWLAIYFTKTSMKIVNTYGNIIPPGDLFARFKRSQGEKDSTGLGLSIVDTICKKNGLNVNIIVSTDEFAIEITKCIDCRRL